MAHRNYGAFDVPCERLCQFHREAAVIDLLGIVDVGATCSFSLLVASLLLVEMASTLVAMAST